MATISAAAPRPATQSRPIAVTTFPDEPWPDGHYVFQSLGRSTVDHNHGLHKYPAKFVPQIPRWAISYDESATEDVVLDPFGGSGTTALEATLLGRQAVSLDISPLARFIASAKTALVTDRFDDERALAQVLRAARHRASRIEDKLIPGAVSYGMHHTWSNWFDPSRLAALLAIRDAIAQQGLSSDLADVLLASLSSVAKSCSLLDENQIKVRLVKDKVRANPFDAFHAAATRAIATQRAVTPLLLSAPRADIRVGSAADLPLPDGSVDRVVTSPPYINAVDYTMAHKYNLFLLGALAPAAFKDHCRDYIGMTERAVRASDLEEMPTSQCRSAQSEIEALWLQGTPLAQNRAFVVAQFFNGMDAVYKELVRVLRPGGKVVTVLGNNRVCGNNIPTAAVCADLAVAAGLHPSLRFFHHIANVSSMRLNRSRTGGKVAYETIDVYDRP